MCCIQYYNCVKIKKSVWLHIISSLPPLQDPFLCQIKYQPCSYKLSLSGSFGGDRKNNLSE